MTSFSLRPFVTGLAAAIAPLTLQADSLYAQGSQDVAGFYSGKTVKLIVGFGAGGGYDTYARLAGRHIGRHIPGKPSVVVQNKPGGGGIIAANYLYRAAPKDGTVMGALHTNTAFNQVIGGKNVRYDARRFRSAGRLTGTTDVHYASAASGVKSFTDLKKRQVVVAGTGPSNNSVVYPKVLNQLMGTKLKIVSGFKGTTAANLALERGEADMVLKPWEAIKSGNAAWLKEGKINLILQYRTTRAPELKHVPTVIELTTTVEQKQIFELLLSSSQIGRSLTLPPDVPAERTAAVRKAFMSMTKDPKMLAEAKKLNIDLDPLSGEEVQKIIDQTFNLPKKVVAKITKILLGK